MIRLPVSSLLLGTLGATLALTFACGGGDDTPGGTSGTSGSGGSGNAPAAGGAGGTVSGSAGKPASGGSAGTGVMMTGGSAGMPGAGGAGATGPTGGSAGSGAVTGGAAGSPAGGSAGIGTSGGSGGTGPMGGTGGTGASSNCTITDTPTMSEKIQTVFNVEVTTDLAGFDGGYIEFGVDTNYGYQAPIDMAAMNKKTMLLGMKQGTDYHYRVVAKAGDATCTGPDKTLTTGSLLTGFPRATVTTPGAKEKLAGGFLIGEFYAGMRKVPFILDKDLDVVWAYDPKMVTDSDGLSRARMSIDGKYMWATRANVGSNATSPLVKKIAMDGSMEEDVSSKFAKINHDFTIVDDEHQTMYFIAYGSGSCDDIVEYDPVTGMNRTVVNIGKAFASGACHCNAIQYSPDDTLVVSELDHQAYVKIDRKTGDIKWVLGGGSDNDFTGDGSTWVKEHNHHMIDKDHMVFFNNGSGTGGSVAIELKLDETAKTATKLWSYTAMPNVNNAIMGDVQRMANGNTIVAYSTQGVIHEVDAMGMLLQTLSWGTGGAIGYIIKRPTLYGKPPR